MLCLIINIGECAVYACDPVVLIGLDAALELIPAVLTRKVKYTYVFHTYLIHVFVEGKERNGFFDITVIYLPEIAHLLHERGDTYGYGNVLLDILGKRNDIIRRIILEDDGIIKVYCILK